MLDLEIAYVDDLPCHRCAGSLICAVRVPHSFLRVDGFEVRGIRTVGLCPRCDSESSAVRAVIEHIVRHGDIVHADLLEIAALLSELAMQAIPADADEELMGAAAAEFVRATL
ncbi:DUF6300 family protein [Nocardia sp. NPDC046473]|uniref:DUF6300 family protein n=1 Tax=Nocardia sp. NPDC046473 TaxID=3155733 RepID=UPI0033C7FDFA